MTDPELIIGYDPLIGDGTATARYTLRVFYRGDISFSDGRPWALCIEGGYWTGGGLPATTLEEVFAGYDAEAELAQRLYDYGFAIISMGYTRTDAGIPGDGAFNPATFKRIGSAPSSTLVLDIAQQSVRCAERDVCHAIQRIRFDGLGIGLNQENNRDGVIAVSNGTAVASFAALGMSRKDPAASPGTRNAEETRLGWAFLRDPHASYNAWVDSTPIRHLTDDAGNVTANIGSAKAAPNGTQNFRDASPLWYGFNFASIQSRNAGMPVFVVSEGPVEYSGPYDYATFDAQLTAVDSVDFVEALRVAFIGLDTQFSLTFHADNSRFYQNPRSTPTDLAAEAYSWVLNFTAEEPGTPPAPSGVEANYSIGFDPVYGDAPSDPRYTAYLWWNESVPAPADGRDFLIIYDGGGWQPNSGDPFETLDLENTPGIFAKLYNEGWIIISAGYTVYDDSLPDNGTFNPDLSFKRIGTGQDSYLAVDGTKTSVRCAERDVCNLLQRIRYDGLGGVDINRTPGRGAFWAKSAGLMTAQFAAIGPDRADPDAAPGSRESMSTRVGALLAQSTVVSIPAYVDSKTGITHFPDGLGGIAGTIGEAVAANGEQYMREVSPLWHGFNLPATRQANANMPVWYGAQSVVDYAGPYTFEDMQGVLVDSHPSEGVIAMRDALLAADTEFGTSTHSDVSVFQFGGPGADLETVAQQQYLIALAGNALAQPEPAEEQVLAALATELARIESPIGPDGQSYYQTVERVARTHEANDNLREPYILIVAADSTYEDQQDGYNQIGLRMRVVLECGVRGADQIETKAARLVADIVRRIEHSDNLGGKIHNWRIVRSERFLRPGKSPRGGALIQIELQSRFRRDDPSVIDLTN